VFRAYIAYHASKYGQMYGTAGALDILLLWLYFTAVAILIGGDANCEIENAAAQNGQPGPLSPLRCVALGSKCCSGDIRAALLARFCRCPSTSNPE
jgi:hypothetical protein